ncbi:diguanylate cyclase [Bermanella sp. R86510]|uniref:sensor domain-containing diguanylate cyclase n=1 Tax=unclassified Bermanella TaxID=2627862 RepID=UPI0037CC490D
METPKLIKLDETSMQAVLDVVSDGIWDWHAESGYVYRNEGWYSMLGYDPHSLENTVFTWDSLIHPGDYEYVMDCFDEYLRGDAPEYRAQYRIRTHNGSYIWIEDRAKAVFWNKDGTIGRMIGAHRNIDPEKRLIEEYQKQNKSLESMVDERTQELIETNLALQEKAEAFEVLARTDSLTNTANRRHFETELHKEIERSQRFKEPLSILAIDIDNFKVINDEHGHNTGDLVLITVANIIKQHIREIDTVARWGGDEIMVLLPHTSMNEAVHVAEKTRALINTTSIKPNLCISISVGVAELMRNEQMNTLLQRADKALYQSKEHGRNQVYLANDEKFIRTV